jgi:predicted RNA-binding Zn ribbon-like protein
MPKDETAPGGLERLRQFVNTIDLESSNDELGEPARAAAWLARFGFRAESTALDLDRLRAFREAIRTALQANAGEGDLDLAWERLAAFGPAEVKLIAERGAGVRLLPAATSAEEAVRSELLAAIYDAVRDGSWRRLKACHKRSCLWAYYDHSKNGSGTWCNMATCGNRMKAQRRRSRAAVERPAD